MDGGRVVALERPSLLMIDTDDDDDDDDDEHETTHQKSSIPSSPVEIVPKEEKLEKEREEDEDVAEAPVEGSEITATVATSSSAT